MRDMLQIQEDMDRRLDQRDEELRQLRSQSQADGAQLAALSCQDHSTLSSQRVFEGTQLTQLVQLVTAGRLFPCHKGRVDP